MLPVGERIAVTVPATSANLGPGFDSFGLALELFDEYTAALTDTPGVTVTVTGAGVGEVPTGWDNLVAHTIAHVFKRVGQPLLGLSLTTSNRIPHGRGLGSSGAAIVGGVRLAAALLEGTVKLDLAAQLELATELEGHPDNVAPGLYGGFTVSWMTAGRPGVVRLDPVPQLAPLVLVPDFKVSTKHARSLQPDTVPYPDAVFNVSRAALLVTALTQEPQHLFTATEDRLHQRYRAPAMADTAAVLQLLRDAGFAAVVSGAGPSALVLCADAAERERARNLLAEKAPSWELMSLAVAAEGARVRNV